MKSTPEAMMHLSCLFKTSSYLFPALCIFHVILVSLFLFLMEVTSVFLYQRAGCLGSTVAIIKDVLKHLPVSFYLIPHCSLWLLICGWLAYTSRVPIINMIKFLCCVVSGLNSLGPANGRHLQIWLTEFSEMSTCCLLVLGSHSSKVSRFLRPFLEVLYQFCSVIYTLCVEAFEDGLVALSSHQCTKVLKRMTGQLYIAVSVHLNHRE